MHGQGSFERQRFGTLIKIVGVVNEEVGKYLRNKNKVMTEGHKRTWDKEHSRGHWVTFDTTIRTES